MRNRAAVVVAAVATLAACDATMPSAYTENGATAVPAATPTLSAPPTTLPQTGLWPVERAPLARCDRPLPRPAMQANRGVRGEADHGSVVALLFFDTRTKSADVVPVNTDVKIVWRVTGHGDVTFYATGPSGHRVRPQWGPDPHTDSTFRYPGREWGTGFVFPAPGCWTIHVQRDDLAGRLMLPVR